MQNFLDSATDWTVRRRVAAGSPPEELFRFDPRAWIPAGAESDPFAASLGHSAWRQARAEWVAAGGNWPGGEGQREMQEAILTPDEPFDGKV